MIGRGTLARYVGPGTVLIETGTREGNTVQTALDLGARKVLSVENQPSLHAAAQKRFHADRRVKLFVGSSVDLLGSMIDDAPVPAVFWLDAHSTNQPTPILNEIAELIQHMDKVKTVLIDDVRLYRTAEWGVTLGNVVNALGSKFRIHMEDGFVPYDILVAEPV